MHYLYILYSPTNDKFYVGESSDYRRRLIYHNQGKGSAHTARYRPWDFFAVFEVSSGRADAVAAEKFIKAQKSREFLKRLGKIGSPTGKLSCLKRIEP